MKAQCTGSPRVIGTGPHTGSRAQWVRAAVPVSLLALSVGALACSSSDSTSGGTAGGTRTTSGAGGSSTGTSSGGNTTGAGGSGNGAGTTTGGATTTTGTGGATSGGTTTTTTGTGGSSGGMGGTGGAGGGPVVDAGSPDSGVPGCNLNTGYNGDDQCLLPPPPDKGFQVHIGPTDYKNPGAEYLLQPGQEVTNDLAAAASPNTTQQYFFYRQYRMRPTAHHIIITAPNGSDVGRRIGTANKSEDYPTGGVIAPEDKNVGIPIAPNTPISVSFHAINTGTKPQLRELWVNFWYRDPKEVTQPATEWFETGNVVFAIPPHTKTQLGPSTCTVQGNGRLLWAYGHRHANNTRFLITRIRGTQRDVIYDANKWDEPLLLEFSSTVTNRAPDPAAGTEGGWNGILDLMTGDKIEWTCDVNNTTDGTLRFTNNTYTGEMCIIDAEAVTSTCQ
ncbi:MAG TPA: hypothetical protein VK550_04610 [Polyangiaceae bacterium]|nr:hypothetical protein [Polyangiaceae bacterium]